MSERSRNRDIVDRMAAQVKEHYERAGRPMTSGEAHRTVAERARRRDAMRAAGDTRNKQKGVESGKRQAREAMERAGISAEQRRIIEKVQRGSVFVDQGKKG